MQLGGESDAVFVRQGRVAQGAHLCGGVCLADKLGQQRHDAVEPIHAPLMGIAIAFNEARQFGNHHRKLVILGRDRHHLRQPRLDGGVFFSKPQRAAPPAPQLRHHIKRQKTRKLGGVNLSPFGE